MARRTVVKVELIGRWREYVDSLDGAKFKSRLEELLVEANERIGARFQADARRLIRGRSYAENSPLTVILKGSTAPLVDRGSLFNSLTYDIEGPYAVRVGALRKKMDGDRALDLAWVLHEGATINVGANPKIRRKVWAMVRQRLAAAAAGKGRKARREVVLAAGSKLKGKRRFTRKQIAFLIATGKIARPGKQFKPTTSPYWIIPARPFVATPLADKLFQRYAGIAWAGAVRRALAGE